MTDDDLCGYEDTAGDHPCQNPATNDNGRCWIPSHNDPNAENPHGRDPKLTVETQEQIAQAIEGGKSVNSSARMAGVHPSTVYAWVERGADQEEGIYRDFHDRYVRARGYGEDFYVQSALDMATEERDLATLMSMLKSRYPESWGDVNRGEQTGGVTVNLGESQEFEIDPETLELIESERE